MRRVTIWALAAALALGVAACERNDKGDDAPNIRASTVIEPETEGIEPVPQAEPGVVRAQWRAINEGARAVTGNLRVSIEALRGGPLIFAFANGITMRAQAYAQVPADSRSGVGGQSFAAVMGGDPRVDAYLYRVLEEDVTSSATRGSLCGEASTRYMAVSEFVDANGRWAFRIAAFRGEAAPPSANAQHCASYAFTAQ